MNQYHSSSTKETYNTQSSQDDHKNIIEIPHRLYKQVIYDDELQAYLSVDTNARVPEEGCMYVIFHEPTKRYFKYNTTVNQFKLTNARDCDWTTQYLLCTDYIFHQTIGQTNYVKQPKN